MSKSKLPAILGGCGCLSLVLSMALFAAAFFVTKGEVHNDENSAEAPAAVERYENKAEGRSGPLAQYFVPFEFVYPKSWVVKPQGADGPNFVSVERGNGDVTYENFNVGYFDTAGGRAINAASYAALMSTLQSQFSQQYSNLQKIHEGPTKVGSYDGYEGLFSASVNANGRDVDIYTRTILLPTPDKQKGVAIVMMGTSLAPELKQPQDLGTKGELPRILPTFRFLE
jgi:hypothetical protein